MFRNLTPALADLYHVIAPDYPGYGQSDMPDRSRFAYTFDRFAELVDGLLAEAARLGAREHAHALRDVNCLRSFLSGSGILALFDAPWLPIFVVVIISPCAFSLKLVSKLTIHRPQTEYNGGVSAFASALVFFLSACCTMGW